MTPAQDEHFGASGATASPDEPVEDDDERAAWEALEEDRRQQRMESGRRDESDSTTRLQDNGTAGATPPEHAAAEAGIPPGDDSPDPPPAEVAEAPTATRRIFVINSKDLPDPDPKLPVTGPRSVQAVYQDYFPGQLDNVDVQQRTRPDGSEEYRFTRRIGTKGVDEATGADEARAGEIVITIPRVVGVIAALKPDRPLAWDLVEQALDAHGEPPLDYLPATEALNLAEAQRAAREALIAHTVRELGRVRPAA
jgi:PRTRC genetic system protein C